MTAEFPELTLEALKKIIAANLPACPAIEMVGLVGSYARGQQNKNSDVDLVVHTEDSRFGEMLSDFGMKVSDILDYRFNKRLEIIRYSLVVKRAKNAPESDLYWYFQDGYRQMLEEVKWLYERPCNFGKNRELFGAS
jgi:predicted nucleotidyltransferase